MLCIFVTSEVSKLERSRVVKEEQSQNMQLMSVTLEVSKFERSVKSNQRTCAPFCEH